MKRREARTRTSILRRRKHTSCMQPPAVACMPLRYGILEIGAVCVGFEIDAFFMHSGPGGSTLRLEYCVKVLGLRCLSISPVCRGMWGLQ